MRRARSLALVCAGPISRTSLSRLPRLREQLGLVKASSYRLASRAVNSLRAGFPVHSYEELGSASLILISVPEPVVQAVVYELSNAKISWHGKVVALYETAHDTAILCALGVKGAEIATVNTIGGHERNEFLLEGSSAALRTIRKFLLTRSSRTIEVRHGRKSDYMDAVHLAANVVPSLVEAISERLRSSGLTRSESERLAQDMLTNAMKAFFRAGARAVRVPINWIAWLDGPGQGR